MFVILALYVMVTVRNSDCGVLDPALYLSPSPPVKSSDAGSLWSLSTNLRGINIENGVNALSKSRTFWPKIQTDYRLGGIHIPLTFSLSGSYGSQVTDAVSAVGTSYADISGITRTKIIQSNSKPSFVGAQYDVYNSGPSMVRIYGGSNKPAWSGWGNGKWGHYGKG